MSKNYKVSSNSATKNFTVGTAVIDLDALSWTYNEDGVGAMTTDDTQSQKWNIMVASPNVWYIWI